MLDCVSGGEKEEKWYVAPALVETGVKEGDGEEEGVWAFTNHIFVASTRDGGLAPYLTRLNGREMRCWNERSVDDPKFASRGNWSLSKSGTKEGRKEGEGMLEVKCQCGGIDFRISRPTSDDALPAHIRPGDPLRWIGQHCACTSCCLSTSTPISSWIYVPTGAVTASLSSLPATAYQSSQGVTRSFCGTCGTCVCVVREDEPGVVQIAAGLVRAKGARAEEWVEWKGEIGGVEEKGEHGMGSVVEALRKGLRAGVGAGESV